MEMCLLACPTVEAIFLVSLVVLTVIPPKDVNACDIEVLHVTDSEGLL